MNLSLLLTTLTNIILMTIYIFNIPKIYENALSVFSSYGDEMTEYLNNFSIKYYYILAIIILLILIIMLIVIIKKKENYKRNLLIGLNIFLAFLESDFSIYLCILCFINIWFLSQIKPLIQEKKTFPKMKNEINKTLIIKSIILIFIYFSQLWIPKVFNISSKYALIYYIALDSSLLIITISLFFKELFTGIKYLFKNIEAYFPFIVKTYLKNLLIYIPLSLLAFFILESTSVNQQALESLPFLYVFLSALFFAPVVEEAVFRLALHKLIKNSKIFIILSGLIFGFLHAISEPNILSMIITALPYASLGSLLAYLYDKTGNIGVNIMAHFLINFMGCLVLLGGL